MTELKTWGGRKTFKYTGSVKEGTVIIYGSKENRAKISAQNYKKLLDNFRGREVNIGTSRDNPPKGSVGEWLKANVSKIALASYVGPILIHEGYGERADGPNIRFKQ